MMQTPNASTLRQLLHEVSRDLYALGAQTGTLAGAEIRAATSTLKFSLALGAIGMVLAAAGLLVLVGALVLIAIALGLPAWAAAVSVGLLSTAAGAVALWLCVARLRRSELTLQATRSSVAETWQWLKAETRR